MPQQITPQSLTKTIRSQFNMSELDDLCFELGIPPGEISGDTIGTKARELVLYSQRRNRLPELEQAVRSLRPNLSESKLKRNKTMSTKTVSIIVALIGALAVIISALITTFGGSKSEDSFEYQIHVQVEGTGADIQGAEIIIMVGGQAPKNEITDNKGTARFFIDGEYIGQPGRLTVEASGYERYTQNIDLDAQKLPDTVQLKLKP